MTYTQPWSCSTPASPCALGPTGVTGEGTGTRLILSEPVKHSQDSPCSAGIGPCGGWLLADEAQSGKEQTGAVPDSAYKPGRRFPLGTSNVCKLCYSRSCWKEVNKHELLFSVLCPWRTSLFIHTLLQRAEGTLQDPRAHTRFSFLKVPWPGSK